ncbi:MAG: hypothetical protein ABI408_08685 [Gemmatimonadaceae bacterium]
MLPSPPTSHQLAQRLLERERHTGGADITRSSAAAQAGEELYRALSRWIGSDGCHALFTRARAQEQAENRPLELLQLRPRQDPYISGVDEAKGEYGDEATGVAIESMIVGMIELLGRLIGVDMATNLIERSLSEFAQDKSAPAKRRAKA